MSSIRDDWKAFLDALAKHGVEYLIVGGVAVGVHGHVRYTRDLHIWFRGSESNAAQLIAALGSFGFETVPVPLSDFCKPRGMIVLGVEPNAIELINFADGVDFDGCFERRIVTSLDGIEVAVIGLDDLRANKRTVGRLQDLADLENLETTQVAPENKKV